MEAAENRIVLQSDTPASTEVDTVAEGEFPAKATARVDPNAEVALATLKDGFKLGIAFKALCHVAHGCPRGLVTGHVARLILALAGLAEFPPAFHEAVGSQAGIGAKLGFQLQGADCAPGVAGPASAASAVAPLSCARAGAASTVMGRSTARSMELLLSLTCLQFIDIVGRNC